MQSFIKKNIAKNTSPFHTNDLFLYEPVEKKRGVNENYLKQNVLSDKLCFTCNIFEKSNESTFSTSLSILRFIL